MTPAQIETAARRKYNSSQSSFFSSAEIYDLIYQAELEIAQETKVIEVRTVISGGSVASQQAYTVPTTIETIKRVEYDGRKLERIDLRQDDAMTLLNSNTTAEGDPLFYHEWAGEIYLRPIPQTSSEQIRVYGFGLPAAVTSASQTLEVNVLFHMNIVDRVVAEMAMKDGNSETADRYFDIWYTRHLPKIKAWYAKKKSSDTFKVVKDIDSLANTLTGNL